jgi:hypothetical protein
MTRERGGGVEPNKTRARKAWASSKLSFSLHRFKEYIYIDVPFFNPVLFVFSMALSDKMDQPLDVPAIIFELLLTKYKLTKTHIFHLRLFPENARLF